jgi:RNA polymerase sigma factor (sigma-70 family)
MDLRRRTQRIRDPADVDEIVSTFQGPLLRYVARVLSNPSAAEDVVQNTFIKMLRSWRGPLETGPKMSAWLYRVAHNEAVDYVRRESRRHDAHESQAQERPTTTPPNRGAGFRLTEQAVEASDALQALNERERQLVVLKVYEEKSYREISEITGLSSGNVGYILHHAMKKLARTMPSRTAAPEITGNG